MSSNQTQPAYSSHKHHSICEQGGALFLLLSGDWVTLERKINLAATELLNQNPYSTGKILREQRGVARVRCLCMYN